MFVKSLCEFDSVEYIIYNKFKGDFNMSECCYLVHRTDDFGEGHTILAMFKEKQKAEKYCEIQEQLDDNNYYGFYVTKETFKDDSFDMDTKVSPYYFYMYEFDEPFNLEELDEDNESFMEAESQIYSYDNYVQVSEDSVIGYSTQNYETAREITLHYLKKGETSIKYEIIDKQKDTSDEHKPNIINTNEF